MAKFNKEDTIIVITSDEPWGNVMHDQLHYAFQLSKEFDVIYINPPRIWSPATGFVYFKNTFRVNSMLLVIPYRHLFPLRVFRYIFTFINDILTSMAIRKFIQVGKSNLVLWRFDHFRFFTAWLPKPVHTIYHVVDSYAPKPADDIFATGSDLVVVANPGLVDYYRKLNPNVLQVPQCIPQEDNHVNPEIVDMLKSKYGDYLLFVGSVSKVVDIDLLEQVALQFNSRSLLVIGPVVNLSYAELDRLKDFQTHSNVHFLGTIPGLDLKHYIKGASVCLVPYKFNEGRQTGITSPLKILNYISQKRPVVTSIESELPDPETMGVYYVSNAIDFLSKISECMEHPASINEAMVDAYIQSVNYTVKIDEILSKLDESVS